MALFTKFSITYEPSNPQKSIIRQIDRLNLSNLHSRYLMALTGLEVGEKRSGMSRKFDASVSI